jgi:hypothetical protein
VAWVAAIPGSPAKYLAVFNLGDTAAEEIRVNCSDLGLRASCLLRDLWAKKDLGRIEGGGTFSVRPHASLFYKLTPAP